MTPTPFSRTIGSSMQAGASVVFPGVSTAAEAADALKGKSVKQLAALGKEAAARLMKDPQDGSAKLVMEYAEQRMGLKRAAQQDKKVAVAEVKTEKSVRKDLYPTRARKADRERAISNSRDAEGSVTCDKCGDAVPENQITLQHEPPLVETHNSVGWNTDQPTRNNLYNSTITGVNCRGCQAAEGGGDT